MKNKKNHRMYAVMFLIFCNFGTANSRYLLCGSDEDGCDDYRNCACIPYNEAEANKRFCLDIEGQRCLPLTAVPHCNELFIHINQAECLATLFQSEPRPPCRPVSDALCLDNHIAICDEDGNFSSCVVRKAIAE